MRASLVTIASLIALGVGSRLLPHPPNMTAINAIALKSRAQFGVAGLLIPLVSMALSDLVIGFYDWRLLLSVYVSFALVGLLGRFLQSPTMSRVSVVSLIGSILFFLTTNAVVWATSVWYPPTLVGLASSYAAGLPFLLSMLVGDMVYTTALFRVMRTAESPRTAQEIPGTAAGNLAYQLGNAPPFEPKPESVQTLSFWQNLRFARFARLGI